MEQEKIEKMISNTLICIESINELNTKNGLTEQEASKLERNKEHLKFVMKKDWFVNNITESQKQEIETLIK